MWLSLKTFVSGTLIVSLHQLFSPKDESLRCPTCCVCITSWMETTVVNCSSRNLTYLPQGIPEDVAELYMQRNKIKYLNPVSFQDMTSLTKISLANNEVSVFPSDTDFLRNITFLDMSYNQLQSVPSTLPKKLQILNIGHNEIRLIPEEIFCVLSNLEELYIHGNKLTTFSTFSRNLTFHKLRIVYMPHNNVQTLADRAFIAFPMMQQLSLAGNELVIIRKDSFLGLSHLRTLDLSNNTISQIDAKAFASLANLRYLHLQHNTLRVLAGLPPELDWLDVSHNRITTVSEHYNMVFFQIEVINLAGNPLNCTCELLWLKEFTDSRMHVFNQLEGRRREYFPSCGSPPTLSGQSWQYLSDDAFGCSESDEPQSVNFVNTHITTTGTNQRHKCHISSWSVTNITHKSVFLHWVTISRTEDPCAIFVYYYIFGLEESSKLLQFQWEQNVTLDELTPATNYIICVSTEDPTHVKLHLDQCKGLTLENAPSYILNLLIYFCVAIMCSMALGTLVISMTAWNLRQRNVSHFNLGQSSSILKHPSAGKVRNKTL